ncbi:MAG: hypothetical protein H0T92_04285 [Pyrinomonadaceae bacterium]|nr:hypothetical protein [Pyrinomonadaceae bacterium]
MKQFSAAASMVLFPISRVMESLFDSIEYAHALRQQRRTLHMHNLKLNGRQKTKVSFGRLSLKAQH